MSPTSTRRGFFRSAGVGTVGLAAGVTGTTVFHAVGHGIAGDHGDSHGSGDGEPTEVDFGFCADMTHHHVQALAMCQRVLGRDTGDPVQAAAAEVLQNQSIEVGMMRAWLTDWGQPTTSPEIAMAWMSMHAEDESAAAGIPIETMPGLASEDEMRALGLASGMEQGRMWLELMRAHHVGGVDMATAAIEMAGTEKVRRIAQVQVDVQSYEISLYDMLLTSQYAGI
jgi:uncharacterized protein (DUF305 family)